MNFILLIDLDDTLLENSMGNFIPAYLNLLGNQLTGIIPSDKIAEAILSGTEKMVINENPSITLEECFDSYFYPKINESKIILEPVINHFYKDVFPDLKYLTKPIEKARAVINNLMEHKYQIIIATNPLFPKAAILHRLDWANLDVESSIFNLITSYEDFHFAKPNPAYYAEILSKLGWQEGKVAMIGNDLEMDIKPAEDLGIPTFLLTKNINTTGFQKNPLSSSGYWDDIELWINKLLQSDETFELNNSYIAYRSVLLSTAAKIDSVSRKYPDVYYWKEKPNKSEWSLVEITSHLADVDEEVNILRMLTIQSDPDPFFLAAFTDEWAETRNYINYNPMVQIERFISNRKKLVQLIDSFSEDVWNKPVTHVIFGPTSVLEIIKFIVQHDRIHVNQIFNTINFILDDNNQSL